MNRYMNKYVKVSLFTVAVAIVVTGAGFGLAQGDKRVVSEESVLVDVAYDNGVWRGEVRSILPCGSPSKPLSPPEDHSVGFSVFDRSGKELYKHAFMDPRIVLIEDPRELPDLLTQVKFTAVLPYFPGMQEIRFFEDVQKRDAASLVVDMKYAVDQYEQAGGRAQKATCQIPLGRNTKLDVAAPADDKSGATAATLGRT